MNTHHLIRMNKSSGVNKNMSSDRTYTRIFFKRKCQDSIFSELFTIWECISSHYSDGTPIDIKGVKCEFELVFCELPSFERKNFSCHY